MLGAKSKAIHRRLHLMHWANGRDLRNKITKLMVFVFDASGAESGICNIVI